MAHPIVIRKVIDTTSWESVALVYDDVVQLLGRNRTDVVDAVAMVVTELVENAIKYHEPQPRCPTVDLELEVAAKRLKVTVSNGVGTDANLRRVRAGLDRLGQAQGAFELYADRVAELFHDPTPRATGIGLYRIVYEGNFRLDHRFVDGTLVMIATRDLDVDWEVDE